MRKHRWKLLGVLTAALAFVAVGVFALWPRPDRLMLENFRRIRLGMSQAEVEAALGPAGDHTTGETELDLDEGGIEEVEAQSDDASSDQMEVWESDRVHIGVRFDAAGNVSCAICGKVRTVNRGYFDNLLWRAKRQWFPEK